MSENMHHICTALALALTFCSYIPHLFGIYKKRVKPHAFTWFIWGLMMGAAFLIQKDGGAGQGSWSTSMMSVVSFLIFFLALKYGEKNITKSDWACFVAALGAIPLWIALDNPLYSVVLIAMIDTLGFIPTIRKTWLRPYQEAIASYVIAVLACILSTLVLEKVTLVTALVPAVIIVTNTGFVAMALFRRRQSVNN